MTELTREQRDNRDQASARAAIELAQDGKVAGIVVDDARKSKRMLRRVSDIATSMRIEFEVERDASCIDVIIGQGRVRIMAADKLAAELRRGKLSN